MVGWLSCFYFLVMQFGPWLYFKICADFVFRSQGKQPCLYLLDISLALNLVPLLAFLLALILAPLLALLSALLAAWLAMLVWIYL